MACLQRRSCGVLAWALAAILVSSAVHDSVLAQTRVRKELRNLTQNELNLYVRGLTIMMNTSTAQGQAKYGAAFREYNYFVVKHAVTTADPRGDQGHFGPCFITFHRAFAMEFENALLSVVPQLGAMPYWNLLLDVRGGPYAFGSPKYMFSSAYAGSIWTSARNQNSPTDGLFSGRTISKFDWNKYGWISGVYRGSMSTGYLRGAWTPTNTNKIVRYPMKITDSWCYYSDSRPGEFQMNYHLPDWQLCLDATRMKTMMDWHWCMDFNGYEAGGATTPYIDSIILNTCSSILHAGPHLCVGGSRSDGTPGDFMDTATAPNEVMLFMLHHANIDRSFMIWQTAASRSDPSLSNWNVLWKFPQYPGQYPRLRTPYISGCYLHDTINAYMPFTDIFSGVGPENADGFTHADVLWYTRPGYSPYIYDNMGTGL